MRAARFSSSMSRSDGRTTQVASDEPVHERVERERVVRAGREAEASARARDAPPRRGPAAARAAPRTPRRTASARDPAPRPRSRRPAPRRAGTPADCGGSQHAVALHRLDLGVACRRRRGRSSRSAGRAPSGMRAARRRRRARVGPSDGGGSERRRWSLVDATRCRSRRRAAAPRLPGARRRCRRAGLRGTLAPASAARVARAASTGPSPHASARVRRERSTSSWSVAATSRITRRRIGARRAALRYGCTFPNHDPRGRP